MIREPLDDELSDEHLRSHRASQGLQKGASHAASCANHALTPRLLDRIERAGEDEFHCLTEFHFNLRFRTYVFMYARRATGSM